MKLHGAEIVDTFAEAFPMWGARVVITAATPAWALRGRPLDDRLRDLGDRLRVRGGHRARARSGRDARRAARASARCCSRWPEGVGKQLVERVGQCVLTCPTTACFAGMPTARHGRRRRAPALLRRRLADLQGPRRRRYWRVPVMDGEFLVQERFGVVEGVGGGNLILFGRDTRRRWARPRPRSRAMRDLPNVIMPFPGGIVRSGSKVGSKYAALPASTNDALCPTLRGLVEHSDVPPDVAACSRSSSTA